MEVGVGTCFHHHFSLIQYLETGKVYYVANNGLLFA